MKIQGNAQRLFSSLSHRCPVRVAASKEATSVTVASCHLPSCSASIFSPALRCYRTCPRQHAIPAYHDMGPAASWN
eukprot:688029-Amphidinium_carterae.1